jgi:hypothetical protein
LTTARIKFSSSAVIPRPSCRAIHDLSFCHCLAFALSGSLACKPDPDRVFTQLGSTPHSGNACMPDGLPGALLQPPTNTTQDNIRAKRVYVLKFINPSAPNGRGVAHTGNEKPVTFYHACHAEAGNCQARLENDCDHIIYPFGNRGYLIRHQFPVQVRTRDLTHQILHNAPTPR